MSLSEDILAFSGKPFVLKLAPYSFIFQLANSDGTFFFNHSVRFVSL